MPSPEQYTDVERGILANYFTNLDGPVFALINMPEVTKGALFSRYSRTGKPLRRLFLDEFAADTVAPTSTGTETDGGRAEKLYQKVFVEYGDDSVAQLGGAHIACEGVSNVLTKLIEWGRLASYLEQSTRYIPYDTQRDGQFLYYQDPEIVTSEIGSEYVAGLDSMFEGYSSLLERLPEFLSGIYPQDAGVPDRAYRASLKAKALDALRGLLPAATQSNLGIYTTGQGYEALIMRLQSHPLPEARWYAAQILTELRKVIPSFLHRVDLPERGLEWSAYQEERSTEMGTLAARMFDGRVDVVNSSGVSGTSVHLTDFDPQAEVKMIAAMLSPYTHMSDQTLESEVQVMSLDERMQIVNAYVGDRKNRRHKPGRGLERVNYRFDVVADYGAFRDLQRHRMLTIEWQKLTTAHGYTIPTDVVSAGMADEYAAVMETSAHLHGLVASLFPSKAAYPVALGYKIRFTMNMNAREAMHMVELRSAPQGHASYREVAQQMHREIEGTAGHQIVAGMMAHVDHSGPDGLGRLEAEKRAEQRRNLSAS